MLLEGLVAYSCLVNKGCTESIGQYYHYNPQVQQAMLDHETRIKNHINPTLVNYVIPALGFLTNGSYHTSINGVGAELGINNIERKYFLTFKLSF